MDYTIELYKLTYDFMKDYPSGKYPELLCKLERPFTCLLVNTHRDFYICIPFRSNIRHRDAFMFESTQRSKISKSGLDYTKIILVKDKKYVDNNNVIVDQDEYGEVLRNIGKIVDDATSYVDGYIAHVTGAKLMNPKTFLLRYRYSTLPYFHDIMKI